MHEKCSMPKAVCEGVGGREERNVLMCFRYVWAPAALASVVEERRKMSSEQ